MPGLVGPSHASRGTASASGYGANESRPRASRSAYNGYDARSTDARYSNGDTQNPLRSVRSRASLASDNSAHGSTGYNSPTKRDRNEASQASRPSHGAHSRAEKSSIERFIEGKWDRTDLENVRGYLERHVKSCDDSMKQRKARTIGMHFDEKKRPHVTFEGSSNPTSSADDDDDATEMLVSQTTIVLTPDTSEDEEEKKEATTKATTSATDKKCAERYWPVRSVEPYRGAQVTGSRADSSRSRGDGFASRDDQSRYYTMRHQGSVPRGSDASMHGPSTEDGGATRNSSNARRSYSDEDISNLVENSRKLTAIVNGEISRTSNLLRSLTAASNNHDHRLGVHDGQLEQLRREIASTKASSQERMSALEAALSRLSQDRDPLRSIVNSMFPLSAF